MWSVIWEEIKRLLQEIVGDAEHPDHWKVSVDGVAAGPVTHVAFGSAGVFYTFTWQGAAHKVAGEPTATNHAEVVFDDAKDEGAHMAVSTRSQPLAGKPVIVVVEFVDVAVGGAKHRVRFDCPN